MLEELTVGLVTGLEDDQQVAYLDPSRSALRGLILPALRVMPPSKLAARSGLPLRSIRRWRAGGGIVPRGEAMSQLTEALVSLAREALWQAEVGVERESRLRKFQSRVGIDMRPEDRRAILEDDLELMPGECEQCGEALAPRQRSLGVNLCRRCAKAAKRVAPGPK